MTDNDLMPFVHQAGHIHTLLDLQADKGPCYRKFCGGSELVWVFLFRQNNPIIRKSCLFYRLCNKLIPGNEVDSIKLIYCNNEPKRPGRSNGGRDQCDSASTLQIHTHNYVQ